MKNPKLSIIKLSIVLIFLGAVLQNWIPISVDWQKSIGMISFFVGTMSLIKLLIKPEIYKIEK